MSDGWNHAGRSGAEHPLQEDGQQWLEVSLGFGMDKTQKSSHRDPERNGADVAGDRHRACVWGQGRQRARVRFRIQRRNQSQGAGGITVTEQRTPSEPHHPDPDRVPETEVPGERQKTQEEGGRRGLPGGGGGGGDKGHRDGEKAWGPWLLPPAWTRGFTQRAGAGFPTGAGRAARLRGPGAPWPRTARPACGRAAPSPPAAPRGRGRRRPRSPGS